MVAPTITWQGNDNVEATPNWVDMPGQGGFSEMRATGASKANLATTDSNNVEWWVIATADVEILSAEWVYTEGSIDKAFRIQMVNNDTANDFTNVRLTIWDNNNETGTANPICNTGDATIKMNVGRTGKWTDGTTWVDGGAWTYTTLGGTTRKTLGDGEDGIVEDGYYEGVNWGVALSTPTPADNSHYHTIDMDWT